MIVNSIVNGSSKPSQLIVKVIYPKRSLHLCKDCGIFCEGEWEQQRHLDGHTSTVPHSLIVGLICHFLGLINLIGLSNPIGLVGFISLINLVGLICLIDCISHNGLVGSIGFVGLIELV